MGFARIWSSLAAAFVCVVAATNAEASEFQKRCEQLMLAAPDYRESCLKEAVPFTVSFSPSAGASREISGFRVYVRNLDTDSHFVLGCVISGIPQRAYLNIYYKSRNSPLPPLDVQNLKYVDFSTNIAIGDGKTTVHLIAVRQVVVPGGGVRLNGMATNCQHGDIEGGVYVSQSPFLKFQARNPKQSYYCSSVKTCYSKKYDVFFQNTSGVPLFSLNTEIVIMDNGALLIEDEYRREACSEWGDLYSPEAIVLETCSEVEWN